MRLPAPGYHQEREAKTCSTSRALTMPKWKVFSRFCVCSDCGREVGRRPEKVNSRRR